MADHFNLTQEDFAKNKGLFEALEIRSNDVVGKNYKELSDFLKKRHRRLILTYHPDKGEKGDAEKFREVHKAYDILQECIKPLESGNPCTKASVNAENNGRLTAEQFHYRRKLFEGLGISEKHAVGKSFREILGTTSYTCFSSYYSPERRLRSYLFPKNESTDIIHEDKVKLASKIIEKRDFWVHDIAQNPRVKEALSVAIYSAFAVGCYLSWWVLPCYIVNVAILYGVRRYYDAQYRNQKISIDEYISKVNHIYFYNEFVKYSLFALSVCLLTMDFISFGATPDNLYYSIFLGMGISIEIFLCHFSKGCEIYAEKYAKDLMEEDSKDRVHKETDLLKWYDPRLLLMPIIMPLVRMCFSESASE